VLTSVHRSKYEIIHTKVTVAHHYSYCEAIFIANKTAKRVLGLHFFATPCILCL